MGGALLAVQGLLGVAFVTVGVDDGGQVASGAVQVGGVEPAGLGQQGLLTPAADLLGQWEPLDRVHDDVGLVG